MQECFGCCSIYLSMLLPWQRIMARSRWSDGGAIKWLRLNEDKRGTILAMNTLHCSGHSSFSAYCCYWLLLCFIVFYWFMFAVNLLFIYWPRSWTGPRTTDWWLSGVGKRCLRPRHCLWSPGWWQWLLFVRQLSHFLSEKSGRNQLNDFSSQNHQQN